MNAVRAIISVFLWSLLLLPAEKEVREAAKRVQDERIKAETELARQKQLEDDNVRRREEEEQRLRGKHAVCSGSRVVILVTQLL